MVHRLTIGHLDPAVVERRQTVPTTALEMDVVDRLSGELGYDLYRGRADLRLVKVRVH